MLPTLLTGHRIQCSYRHSFARRYLIVALFLFSIFDAVSALSLQQIPKFPTLGDLSKDCETVYTLQIPGCTGSDFAEGSRACSKSCVEGLQYITGLFSQECDLTQLPFSRTWALYRTNRLVAYLCDNENGSPALPPDPTPSLRPSRPSSLPK